MTARSPEVWFAAGARTPFAKVDGPLDKLDAIALSVPIVRHMLGLTLRQAGRIARQQDDVVVPDDGLARTRRTLLEQRDGAPSIRNEDDAFGEPAELAGVTELPDVLLAVIGLISVSPRHETRCAA